MAVGLCSKFMAGWVPLGIICQIFHKCGKPCGERGVAIKQNFRKCLCRNGRRGFSPRFSHFVFYIGPVICLFFQIDIIIFSKKKKKKKKNWYYHIVLCNWNLFLSFWIFALPLCLYNIQYYLKTQRKNAPYCIRRPYVPKWRASSLILIQKSSIFGPWNSWDFYLGSIAAIV